MLVVLVAAALVAGCTADSELVLAPDATAPAPVDVASEFTVTYPDSSDVLAHIEHVDGDVSVDLVGDRATGDIDAITGRVEGEPVDVRFGEDAGTISAGESEIDYSLNPDGTANYKLLNRGWSVHRSTNHRCSNHLDPLLKVGRSRPKIGTPGTKETGL